MPKVTGYTEPSDNSEMKIITQQYVCSLYVAVYKGGCIEAQFAVKDDEDKFHRKFRKNLKKKNIDILDWSSSIEDKPQKNIIKNVV